jgi:hypothetical protein
MISPPFPYLSPPPYLFLSLSLRPPHENGMSCTEASAGQGDQGGHPLAGLDPAKYGICPGCNAIVERISGCPHMACNCGAHFYLNDR